MKKNYSDWVNLATQYKSNLDQAYADSNSRDVIYYRGKYLHALKQAYKLNNSGIVPFTRDGTTVNRPISDVIKVELKNHQDQIDASLSDNRVNSDVKNNTFSTELALKIRRLATRASQVDFSTGSADKKQVTKDALGIAGTALKAPFMITSKVLSKIGPLAITIVGLPFTVLASALAATVDISNGKSSGDYSNTVVHQLSDALKDGVKSISDNIYKSVGKM